MKKILLALLLAFAVSCHTATPRQPETTTTTSADVTIRKPDGSTVTMAYDEFVRNKKLADKYEGIQRSLPEVQKHTTIERVQPHVYKITVTLDDNTKITITLNTDSK